jgi:hypothetical protein
MTVAGSNLATGVRPSRMAGIALPAPNRWDFLLTVAPLPVEGGAGFPINPIGTF